MSDANTSSKKIERPYRLTIQWPGYTEHRDYVTKEERDAAEASIGGKFKTVVRRITKSQSPKFHDGEWAVKKLKAGKKVRFSSWMPGEYIVYDSCGALVDEEGKPARVRPKQWPARWSLAK